MRVQNVLENAVLLARVVQYPLSKQSGPAVHMSELGVLMATLKLDMFSFLLESEQGLLMVGSRLFNAQLVGETFQYQDEHKLWDPYILPYSIT